MLSDLSRCGLVVAELTRCGVLAQKPAQISFANPSFEIHSSKPILFFLAGVNNLAQKHIASHGKGFTLRSAMCRPRSSKPISQHNKRRPLRGDSLHEF